MSNWSPRAAHATEDYRNRVVELDTRITALEAELQGTQAALNAIIKGNVEACEERNAAQTELAALKPLERFQHGVTTCPACHAIMRWEQGEVVEWRTP